MRAVCRPETGAANRGQNRFYQAPRVCEGPCKYADLEILTAKMVFP